MAISDKERRAVAARMREIMRDDPHGWLDIMVAKSVADVMGDGEKIGETIADLIDRPTCTMTYKPGWSGDEIYPTTAYQCSNCGCVVNEGITEYCPSCGCRVSNFETEPER